MKHPLLKSGFNRPGAKAVALVVFLATPGSFLLLPLLAWWVTRRGHLAVPAAIRN